MLKILFFGDIVGKIGRKAIVKELPRLKKRVKPDIVAANGENLSHGRGMSISTYDEMTRAGIDFFTSGNHIWDKKEGIKLLDEKPNLIRPANYPNSLPGRGSAIIEVEGKKILFINLIGRTFFREEFDDPFKKIDNLLKNRQEEKPDAIILDFHAEATSEKKAMGWYLDGRISAMIGTHTHVQTNDDEILPKGTGYLTDLGMVGAAESVIGVTKEESIRYLTTYVGPIPADIPELGKCLINAIILEINPKTGKTVKMDKIRQLVDIS